MIVILPWVSTQELEERATAKIFMGLYLHVPEVGEYYNGIPIVGDFQGQLWGQFVVLDLNNTRIHLLSLHLSNTTQNRT